MNLIDKFHNWRRKQRWNRQYKSGRWNNLKSEKEVARYRQIIEFIKQYGPKDPSILDIGCGEGVLTERMDPKDFSFFMGLDFSSESIKMAANKNLPKSKFIAADAIKFQPPQEFDVIVFNEAFYYIHDSEKQNVLTRMLDSLTPNGILIISIFREGPGSWEYFKNDKRLKELDFTVVTTAEKQRYWKIGVYQKT